jgi:hypothetical protein
MSKRTYSEVDASEPEPEPEPEPHPDQLWIGEEMAAKVFKLVKLLSGTPINSVTLSPGSGVVTGWPPTEHFPDESFRLIAIMPIHDDDVDGRVLLHFQYELSHASFFMRFKPGDQIICFEKSGRKTLIRGIRNQGDTAVYDMQSLTPMPLQLLNDHVRRLKEEEKSGVITQIGHLPTDFAVKTPYDSKSALLPQQIKKGKGRNRKTQRNRKKQFRKSRKYYKK